MARETKSITVAPSDEQDAIEIWQVFGWELLSSQEIFNKDTHKETRNDGIYDVTTTTNYVKLVFSRETTMPNYAQIVALEREYDNIRTPVYYEPTGSGLLKFGGGILAFAGFVGLASGAGAICVIPLILGIGLFIIRGVMRSKANDEYSTLVREARAKRAAVLEKVQKVWKG